MRKLLARLILWAIEPELDRREASAAVTAVKVVSDGIGAGAGLGSDLPRFSGVGGGIARY